ncbi:hypothetical protein J1605_011772 [Eschrichtius robustus]|uniref:Ig-like domain-containing protein n=1 Tax=Eschrichtius robustus TaxID=9764 RepID=A0AB34GP18_ESCRO|nr:hypothetical protein J1605_011772 [Eschrichtius robustus]
METHDPRDFQVVKIPRRRQRGLVATKGCPECKSEILAPGKEGSRGLANRNQASAQRTTMRVLSQVQLQELGPRLVKPSQTLSLTCAVSGFCITTSAYDWSWIRQLLGKELEWMGCIHFAAGTAYTPSLISTVSISRDKFSLQLRSVTTEDIALYNCAKDTQ